MPCDTKTWIWRLMDRVVPLKFELSGTPLQFRPMAGWVAIRRGIPFHLFFFCIRGSLIARVNQTELVLKTGQAMWISPQTAFRIESPTPEECLLIRFRLKVGGSRDFKLALKEELRLGWLDSRGMAWMELLKQKLHWEGTPDSIPLRAALAGLLSDTFLEPGKKPPTTQQGRQFSEGEIRLLFDWMESLPFSARPGLRDFASQLRLSNGYANQICHRSLGMSAERWLIVQRIKAAARQLEESALTISEVSERFGYSSPLFFSRQFRSVMKCSPRDWRRPQTKSR